MNELISRTDNRILIQPLDIDAFLRDQGTNFRSSNEIPIQGQGLSKGTIASAVRKDKVFNLLLPALFQNGSVTEHFRPISFADIQKMMDKNVVYRIKLLLPEVAKRRTMAQNLLQYQKLPADWDGDNGHAPDLLDIENAVAFMDHIPDKGIASAKLMVAGDGDVGFYWRNDNFYLEIGFQDGNISFYGKPSEGEKISGDERFDGVRVPEKLGYWMKFIFSD